MTDTTDRIIGDFLEINSDIISKQSKSTLPKLISNIVYNRYRNRLKKTVNKLKTSNMILSKNNLSEFFIYCYNNFPPKGSYKSVNKIIYNMNTNKIQGIIKFESIQAIIDIEDDYDGFNITVKEKDLDTDTYNNFSIHCFKLESKNNKAKDTISKINKQIIEDLCDFIMENISR